MIIPPLTNQYLNLTKNSSLAVAVGYPDLVSVFAGTVLNQTGQADRGDLHHDAGLSGHQPGDLAADGPVQSPRSQRRERREWRRPITETFVRREDEPELPPPRRRTGAVGWLRANLFSSPGNTVLTLLGLAFVAWALPPIIRWAFIDAVWTGEGREACIAPGAGACWAFVKAKFGQFIYGRYPVEERWRVDLTMALLAVGLVSLAVPRIPCKRQTAILLFVAFPVVAFFLLVGGAFGLPHVETALWGGLMLTLVVATVGIAASMPLGVLLALGRRSKLPVIHYASIAFIEFVRGVPLITVLFMASVMLPLFLPPGVSFDKLPRALIGVTLFSAAYMAEVVRGGLQAIPRGQYEAAEALGFSYWRRMRLIVLPQALKIVIPGIVNSFISLFKDTSLVLIIGIVRPARHRPAQFRRCQLGISVDAGDRLCLCRRGFLAILFRHVALLASTRNAGSKPATNAESRRIRPCPKQPSAVPSRSRPRIRRRSRTPKSPSR